MWNLCPRFGAGSVDGCPPTGALVSSRRSGWLVRHSGPACAGRRSACLNRPSVDPSSTKPATDEPSLPPRSRRAGRPARRRRTGSSGRPPSGDCEGVSERPSRLRHVTETHAGCGSRIVRVGSTTDQPVLVLGEELQALERAGFETETEFQALLARHPRVLDFGSPADGPPLRQGRASTGGGVRGASGRAFRGRVLVESTVEERLAAGRMRLLFVADRIPLELRAIVEFLNRQMRQTDVYAVELTQYRGGGDRDLCVLVPRIHGEVATSAESPPAAAPCSGPRGPRRTRRFSLAPVRRYDGSRPPCSITRRPTGGLRAEQPSIRLIACAAEGQGRQPSRPRCPARCLGRVPRLPRTAASCGSAPDLGRGQTCVRLRVCLLVQHPGDCQPSLLRQCRNPVLLRVDQEFLQDPVVGRVVGGGDRAEVSGELGLWGFVVRGSTSQLKNQRMTRAVRWVWRSVRYGSGESGVL